MNKLKFNPEQRVLFKLSHPDHEVLEGAAIKLANEQAETVHILYDTSGEASTVGDPDLVQSGYRTFEALRALALLGIPSHRVHFGLLPDGLLGDPDVQDDNFGLTTDLALAYDLNTFITEGVDGIDGHTDHIGSHRSGFRSALELGKRGMQVDLLAVNARHRGALRVPVDSVLKERMQGLHVTQDLLGRQEEMAVYGDLLTTQETYDHILRGSIGYTISRIREAHETLQHTHPASR